LEPNHSTRSDDGSTSSSGDHGVAYYIHGITDSGVPETLVDAPGKLVRRATASGQAAVWESGAPLILKCNDFNLHCIVAVLYFIRNAAVENQELERPKIQVPWKSFAKQLVKMGIAKFADDSKGGNHLKNLVVNLCQNQRLTLVQWFLSEDLLGYLLPYVLSHYGLAKVVPVARDLGFEIITNCLELYARPFQSFFPGGSGIIHATNILQDILAAEVVAVDDKKSVAAKAIKMAGEPGQFFQVRAE
jgi:hypothetical protein